MAKWTIDFRDIKGELVHIEIDGKSGSTDVALTPSANPFNIQETTSDNLFTTVRLQTGYIRFIGTDGLDVEEIVPEHTLDRPVTVSQRNGSIIVWRGFLTPHTYGNNLFSYSDEVALPVQCKLSALQDIPFEVLHNSLTLGMLLSRATNSNDPNNGADFFDGFYIPGVLGKAKTSTDDFAFGKRILPEVYNEYKDGVAYPKYSKFDVLKRICTQFGLSARIDQRRNRLVFNAPAMERARYDLLGIDGNRTGTYTVVMTKNVNELSLVNDRNEVKYIPGKTSVKVTSSFSDIKTFLTIDTSFLNDLFGFSFDNERFFNHGTYYLNPMNHVADEMRYFYEIVFRLNVTGDTNPLSFAKDNLTLWINRDRIRYSENDESSEYYLTDYSGCLLYQQVWDMSRKIRSAEEMKTYIVLNPNPFPHMSNWDTSREFHTLMTATTRTRRYYMSGGVIWINADIKMAGKVEALWYLGSGGTVYREDTWLDQKEKAFKLWMRLKVGSKWYGVEDPTNWNSPATYAWRDYETWFKIEGNEDKIPNTYDLLNSNVLYYDGFGVPVTEPLEGIVEVSIIKSWNNSSYPVLEGTPSYNTLYYISRFNYYDNVGTGRTINLGQLPTLVSDFEIGYAPPRTDNLLSAETDEFVIENNSSIAGESASVSIDFPVYRNGVYADNFLRNEDGTYCYGIKLNGHEYNPAQRLAEVMANFYRKRRKILTFYLQNNNFFYANEFFTYEGKTYFPLAVEKNYVDNYYKIKMIELDDLSE